ncbi:unnamed protein product [Cuscuta europaea]|uniref:Protein kinase domain-containing protein n=1 Tax=Cuscuta europaea TaxID=41803 RepID=A0A9P0YZ90_CUSEU|nr:unnamed protein product [Cuscuta europaea]
MQAIRSAVSLQPASVIILLLLLLVLSPPPTANTAETTTTTITKGTNITRPGCQRKCGNLTVPFPFGVGFGSDCALMRSMEINCNTATNPPTPELGNIPVYEISDSQLRVATYVSRTCYTEKGDVDVLRGDPDNYETDLTRHGPYTFSDNNKFTVVGCDDDGHFKGTVLGEGKESTNHCPASCENPEDVSGGRCTPTAGCCDLRMAKGLTYVSITSIVSSHNHTRVWDANRCGYAFIAEAGKFHFRGSDDLKDPDFGRRIKETVPIVIDWAIGNVSCDVAPKTDGYACKGKSECCNAENDSGGYRCKCIAGYEGNPYIDNGCQDINECEGPNGNPCGDQICTNTPGNNTCSCPKGYKSDGKKSCVKPEPPWIKVSIGVGIGLMVLVLGVTRLYCFFKKRRLIRLREKFFRQNGGLILNQRIANITDRTGVDAPKIFTAVELKRATNDYSSAELGRGGNSVVYKGILRDNRVVAIKKSKTMDESKISEFINEVIILTQINHRNVVRLLGCCLEVKVPILVYEYVSHGTLYEHIHKDGGSSDWLSWETRLRIAVEAACALVYLHSAAVIPIFHRDVKSANILLDENYIAKVSDFGASRLIPPDQTHIATLGQGTFGYWDLEYFRTGEFTEKSDVYSFGVVICELLTGMKAVSRERSEEKKNLAMYVVRSMDKNQLFKILDRCVLREAPLEQVERVADLARRCVRPKGKDRPTMKEVVMELERLRKMNKETWGQGARIPRNVVVNVDQMNGHGGSSSPSDLYSLQLNSTARTSEYSCET